MTEDGALITLLLVIGLLFGTLYGVNCSLSGAALGTCAVTTPTGTVTGVVAIELEGCVVHVRSEDGNRYVLRDWTRIERTVEP